MKLQKEIIKKYLHGCFSLTDKAAIDEYFTNQKYHQELNKELSDHWDELEAGEIPDKKDLTPLLDKINHEILLRSTRKTGALRLLWQVYAKTAAVLLIPIIAATFYLNRENNSFDPWIEVHSPYGARTQFSLPDGSTGWLNSGSVIRYPAQFRDKRNIRLDGEAYFDIVKKPDSPFTILTHSMDVKVLGTSFNIVSYDVDSLSEVVVTSGKVQVVFENGKSGWNLSPNERLVYNRKSDSATKSLVDVEAFTSWKTGKLVFLNDNLDEVIRKLSRFYNVEFNIKPGVDHNQSFRAIMEKENLEEVLRYMSLTMEIDYAIQERKADSEGIIGKRKVLITKSIKE